MPKNIEIHASLSGMSWGEQARATPKSIAEYYTSISSADKIKIQLPQNNRFMDAYRLSPEVQKITGSVELSDAISWLDMGDSITQGSYREKVNPRMLAKRLLMPPSAIAVPKMAEIRPDVPVIFSREHLRDLGRTRNSERYMDRMPGQIIKLSEEVINSLVTLERSRGRRLENGNYTQVTDVLQDLGVGVELNPKDAEHIEDVDQLLYEIGERGINATFALTVDGANVEVLDKELNVVKDYRRMLQQYAPEGSKTKVVSIRGRYKSGIAYAARRVSEKLSV